MKKDFNFNLPFDIIKNKPFVDFMKTNGFITYFCYRTNLQNDINPEYLENKRINNLLEQNFIVTILTSNEIKENIGVTRKSLTQYNENMYELGICRVQPLKFGYVIILGKYIEDEEVPFIDDNKLFKDNQKLMERCIENELNKFDVANGNNTKYKNNDPDNGDCSNVSKGNLDTNINNINNTSEEDKNNKRKIIKRKKVVKEKEKERDLRNYPSKQEKYIKWKTKDINDWNMDDFVGWYFYQHVQATGNEDINFFGNYNFKAMYNLTSKCLKLFFNSNKQDFKDYIEFICHLIVSEDSWVDKIINYKGVFNVSKPTFVKEYQKSLYSKVNKKKSKRELDDNAAKNDLDKWIKEAMVVYNLSEEDVKKMMEEDEI